MYFLKELEIVRQGHRRSWPERQGDGKVELSNGDDEMIRELAEGSGQVCVEVRRGKVWGISKSEIKICHVTF